MAVQLKAALENWHITFYIDFVAHYIQMCNKIYF